MMKTRLGLSIIFLLLAALDISAQEDIKAKHNAYYLCIGNMDKKPEQALIDCRAYLSKYPNDDSRLTKFAGQFVEKYGTAREKLNSYLNSLPRDGYEIKSPGWSIYKPDLEKIIPTVTETGQAHTIEIARSYNSPEEEKLLNKAEAVYSNPEDLKKKFSTEYIYWSQPEAKIPDGEPLWWSGPSQGEPSVKIVTTSAVLFYYELSQRYRADKAQPEVKSNPDFSTNLKYTSSINKFEKYEHASKIYKNVYVADMTFSWGQICGDLCGSGYTRNKIVVLADKGEVLGMFLDAPTNNTSWVS